MMKYFLTLLFIPIVGMSAVIPVEKFDQSKLETLLRKIPSAFVEAREENGVTRKTYLYPAQGPLRVVCVADHFDQSEIPTYKSCKMSVEVGQVNGILSEKNGDEYRVIISDPSLAREIYKGISFGASSKVHNSHEQVYGRSFEGTQKNLFRYSFVCGLKSCIVTASTKPSPE